MGCHGGPLGKFGAVVRAAQRAVRSWGRFRDRLAPVLGGPETELRYERLLSKRLLRRTEPFPTRKSFKNANMDGNVLQIKYLHMTYGALRLKHACSLTSSVKKKNFEISLRRAVAKARVAAD